MTAVTGRCHCGAIAYEIRGEVKHTSLCHCGDCRRASGAPAVGWVAVEHAQFRLLQGKPTIHESSPGVERGFCGRCGSGLTYTNEAVIPGLIDIQIATLDDPAAMPPQVQIQMAERLPWMQGLDDLPAFPRYPE